MNSGKSNKGNYGTALKLFLGNNKWSKSFRKAREKGDLYSPELEEKLLWMDRMHITGAIWVAGAILCIMLLLTGLGEGAVLIIIALFTLVDILVISPLLYIAILPGPLSEHVRGEESLSEKEKELAREQAVKDERHEKLMRKYTEYSGDDFDGPMDYIRKINR